MDFRFIGISILLLLPLILLGSYFVSISYEKLNVPFSSYDIYLTHYKHYSTGYAPLIQTINSFVYPYGRLVYDIYFICLMLSMCFVIPFCLLHKLFGSLEMPTLFLYATAIGTNHFVVGLLPQAILVNFILLVMIERRLFIPLFILSWFVHSFGGFFVLIGYLFVQYSGKYER